METMESKKNSKHITEYPNLPRENSNEELDFTDHWAKLEDVIHRGDRLRHEKPQVPQKEYDVINVDFIKEPNKRKSVRISNSYRKPCKTKCTLPHPGYSKTLSMQNFLHRNMCNVPNSKIKMITQRKKSNTKKSQKCPLRIMELAEPTKRHCMETLQLRSHSLPDFMVDRLRKQLRDQKPVIQVSEALTIFKLKKSKNKKIKKTIDVKDSKKLKEMKLFCSIFAAFIVRKLNKPMRTEELSDKLQRISKTVSDEIKLLTKKRTFGKTEKNCNKKLLQDVANKIAIWMALILEDSADKMLLEELRELEEQEGPVLDCLDDIFDSAMDICEPPPPDSFSKSSSSAESFDDAVDKDTIEVDDETTKIVEEQTNDQLAGAMITAIINEIIKEDNIELENEEGEIDKQKSLGDIDRVSNITDLIMKTYTDGVDKIVADKVKKSVTLADVDVEQYSLEDLKENYEIDTKSDDPKQNDDSEAVKFFESDSMLESNYQNQLDIDEDNTAKSSSQDELGKLRLTSKSREDILKEHAKSVRRYIAHNLSSMLLFKEDSDNSVPPNVLPPNEHLLSEVDEGWPQHIEPFAKADALDLVNKSVTSLGNIFEQDKWQYKHDQSLTSEQVESLISEWQGSSKDFTSAKI